MQHQYLGVIFLFGEVAADLNMCVEEIKPGFSDCIARRFTGKGWEHVWEHDWRGADGCGCAHGEVGGLQVFLCTSEGAAG